MVDSCIPLLCYLYGYKCGENIKEFNNKYLSDNYIFNQYVLYVPNFKNPFITNGFLFKISYSSYSQYLLYRYPRIDDNIINYHNDIEGFIDTKNLRGYAHLGFTTSLLISYK
tara:strand:+ start:158 stop:493 length:336 start_codon:yes stop_codon:yes gene_type:complete